MKLLVVGKNRYEFYAPALYKAFEKNKRIKTEFFDEGMYIDCIENSIIRRAVDKYVIGPAVMRTNKKLISLCENEGFDLIFLYSCRVISVRTVQMIKCMGTVVFSYCNDNPYSAWYRSFYWKKWRDSARACDKVYVYRKSNINEAKADGCKDVELLRSYYVNERNYYIPDGDISMDVPDVVFIGHYEDDGRDEYIRQVIEAGIKIGINNVGAWKTFEIDNPNVIRLGGDTSEYNEIINKTKIALNFLSRINRDTYTRRIYEIPATQTMLLSEYSEDIASIYEENKEIVFFKSPKDLVEKIKYYLSHDDERNLIAKSGYERLMRDKNEVGDRAGQVLEDYYKC